MLLSTSDAATLIGITTRCTVTAITSGRLAAVRDERGYWRLNEADVRAFAASRKRRNDFEGRVQDQPSSRSAPRAFKNAIDQIVQAVHSGTLARDDALTLVMTEDVVAAWREMKQTALLQAA